MIGICGYHLFDIGDTQKEGMKDTQKDISGPWAGDLHSQLKIY